MAILSSLPAELLADIAIHTDVPTVLNLCTVSHHVRAAVRVDYVFRELLDRSHIARALRKKWTNVLVPQRPDIELWQRCAMADHRATKALTCLMRDGHIRVPYLDVDFIGRVYWHVPADVHIPHIAELAILQHPIVTAYVWRQDMSKYSLQAAFAMIVSTLLVRDRTSWEFAENMNAERLGDLTMIPKGQPLTFGAAVYIVYDLLMLCLDSYGDASIEPPTIEELQLPSNRLESLERWHAASVQAMALEGVWSGVWSSCCSDISVPIETFSGVTIGTEGENLRICAQHNGLDYRLDGKMNMGSLELSGVETSGSKLPGNGIGWKCELTVFGLAGTMWTEETMWSEEDALPARFAYFWLWKRSESIG